MASDSPAHPGRAAVAGLRAVVAGFAAEGFAAADNLLHLGASVVVLDDSDDPSRAEEAELLGVLGADVRRGAGSTTTLPSDAGLLVVSPGWPADAPLLVQAHARGVAVWSDAELAWRLADPAVPWLVVAGPRGDPGLAVTARMLDAVLRAAGTAVAVVGPTGRPAVEVAMDPSPREVVVAALDQTQLDHGLTIGPLAAVVLLGDDDPAVTPLLGRAYDRVVEACVYAADGTTGEHLVRDAEVVEGARAIGLTLATPSVGMLGVVDDLLVDRAFIAERATSAAELATMADLDPPRGEDPADGVEPDPATLRHALAAAALARALDVPQVAVRDGLRSWARG